MIDIEKHEKTSEIAKVSTPDHPEFIEQKKPSPIQKKESSTSFEWVVALLDFLLDLFIS